MKWQPIETAPKDRRFLGFRPPQSDAFDFYMISVCKYRQATSGKWFVYSEGDYDGLPWLDWTHWMPLPEPPGTE
jgi:hypothetical protein